MRFSIVIQSFLGDYKGAAKERDIKILRAIDSCLNQIFKDFQVIVVADGCEKTFDIIEKHYDGNDIVDCYLITKQNLWSGNARNFGVKKASGDYVCYLDIDDYLGNNHLQIISDQLKDFDWVYFNDTILDTRGRFTERKAMIDHKFQNGTSNICHKRKLNVKWNGIGYGYDDWSIVTDLKKYNNFAKIETPEYIVCHLPQRLDV